MTRLRDFMENMENAYVTCISYVFHRVHPGEGKISRHNTAASRKVRCARKHRIRKIGGHCCDRSFHL